MASLARNPTVLVVDDDRLVRELVREQLVAFGYGCRVARDGLEALSLQDDPASASEILLVDLVLPGMGGLELCQALRAPGRSSTPYFVMMTAVHDNRLLETAFESGVDDYLAKPFEMIELRARLRAGMRVLGLAEDVQRRSDLAVERILHQSHLAELHDVVGTLAHDLRTPLAALRTTAEVLQMQLSDLDEVPAPLKASADRLEALCVHMAETVDNISRSFLGDPGRPAAWGNVDLAELVRSVAKMVHSAVRPGVRLALNVPETLVVRGDRVGLQRLLLNLVGNSLRHTDQGRVEIRIGDGGVEGTVRLDVCDSGEGIDPAVWPMLGEPLRLSSGAARPDHAIAGSGLGLFICRGIAGRHGGRMRVATELGRGTCVKVWLRDDLPDPDDVAPPAPLDAGGWT